MSNLFPWRLFVVNVLLTIACYTFMNQLNCSRLSMFLVSTCLCLAVNFSKADWNEEIR